MIPLPEQINDTWVDWPVHHASDDAALHPNERIGLTIQADDSATWHLCTADSLSVTAGWLAHPVPSYGFVITEQDLPGRLDVQKLKDKGVPPGPLYAKVKAGQTVTSPCGEIIQPVDVMGPSVPGRKVVILGDTSNSDHMKSLAWNADVIVHEATLEDEMVENALSKGHSTPGMAGRFAEDTKAKQLVITHFSQRYKPITDEEAKGTKSEDLSNEDIREKSVNKLLQQAQNAFASGTVVAAYDFIKIPIKLSR